MKPLDPRLLRYARSSHAVFGVGGLLGIVRALAVILWCWCIANAITTLVLPVLGGMGGAAGRVSESAYPAEALPWLIGGATLALLVRSAASWGMDVLSARGAIRVKRELRLAALAAIDAASPDRFASTPDTAPATALGRGLDALDGYFSGYLPQLILTVCATPLFVLAVLLADPVSGLVVIIVFPVIPIFMVLIGLATRAVQQKQWDQLQHLSRSFLDVIEGLTTLKIFGREERQISRIERETGEYRRRTMQVLRVTFLSGFVLDLAGTFSIALVAVTVGTRLVAGEFPLGLGLFVLLLLPEAFMPIRAVGAAFHSSTEGLTAAEEVFELIEMTGRSATPTRATPHRVGIEFDAVVVERDERAVVGPISFNVRPGEIVALAGASGAGKSTLVSALLGFVEPTAGEVRATAPLAWAGQRPGLLQGSIAENVALGEENIELGLVRQALDAVGLLNLEVDLELGAQGTGLSGGQAQRVAIARALYRAWNKNAGAIVLDEPSSALDSASEAHVAAALRAEAESGRAVLLVSHRQAMLESADRVVRIEGTT